MSNKETVKKYFDKYFKAQYFKESDHEFKSLVRILNKKDKQVKNLNIPVVIKSVCKCGNELTEKEIFHKTCLKCDRTV